MKIALETTTAELMEQYEITHVLIDMYHYKTYNYSNLSDAVAQAKLDIKSDQQ